MSDLAIFPAKFPECYSTHIHPYKFNVLHVSRKTKSLRTLPRGSNDLFEGQDIKGQGIYLWKRRLRDVSRDAKWQVSNIMLVVHVSG